jgi:hypothetical protein
VAQEFALYWKKVLYGTQRPVPLYRAQTLRHRLYSLLWAFVNSLGAMAFVFILLDHFKFEKKSQKGTFMMQPSMGSHEAQPTALEKF